jgi:type II restriction enzyme
MALQFTTTCADGDMATRKQSLGKWGEETVARVSACPKCKHTFSLRRLPTNFKCADIICDFCGFLAQVKTATVRHLDRLPKSILGAAWQPQYERMKAGIYFPLFIVLRKHTRWAVYLLPTELQHPRMFKKRKPLSRAARRAGWQGFVYDLDMVSGYVVRVFDSTGRSRR